MIEVSNSKIENICESYDWGEHWVECEPSAEIYYKTVLALPRRLSCWINLNSMLWKECMLFNAQDAKLHHID